MSVHTTSSRSGGHVSTLSSSFILSCSSSHMRARIS
jgi:hypothetical protein